MKIYWKHILYNYTTRLWRCWKYRNNPLMKSTVCQKVVQTGKQMDKLITRMRELHKTTKWQPPIRRS